MTDKKVDLRTKEGRAIKERQQSQAKLGFGTTDTDEEFFNHCRDTGLLEHIAHCTRSWEEGGGAQRSQRLASNTAVWGDSGAPFEPVLGTRFEPLWWQLVARSMETLGYWRGAADYYRKCPGDPACVAAAQIADEMAAVQDGV